MKYILSALVMLNAHASVTKPNIVYGQDNRVEIEEVFSSKIKELAKSVAVRVGRNTIDNYGSHLAFNFAPTLDKVFGAPMCEDQRFGDQPSAADCTGFLIGEDTLVTAGHCLLDYDGDEQNKVTSACSKNYWMFDYQYKNGSINLKNISQDNVYSCEKVLRAVLNETDDYAIVKLDRKVVGRKGLKLNTDKRLRTNTPIFVIGAPSGIPLKYAGGAQVTSNTPTEYFVTNLDTFGGNSGSPVFNSYTLEVEGILVRGRTDYVDLRSDDGKSCIAVNNCDQFGQNCSDIDAALDIDGEHVTRINQLGL